MRRLIMAVGVVSWLAAAAPAQTAGAQAPVEPILKQARAAIGDEAKLKSLRSLALSLTSRRTVGEANVETEIEYEILLPDKFRRSEGDLRGRVVTVIEGNEVWTELLPPGADLSSGGVRRGGERTDPRVEARRQAAQRAEFARALLGWLLMTPAFMPVEYRYGGQVKSADGTAEAIDVTSPAGFTARLWIDQKTHRLQMLTYRGKPSPPEILRLMGRSPSGYLNQRELQEESQLTPEAREKRRQEKQAALRQEYREALAKAPEVEYRWVFSQYKNVKGFSLPHHLVKSEAGKVSEEWEIHEFKINPKLTADQFEMKGKQ